MEEDLEKLRNEKLLKNLLADALTCLNDTLLDTCADQEYRICLLELGINN